MHTLLLRQFKGIGFDANMLIAIQAHGVDVFSDARGIFGGKAKFVVPEQVVRELDKLEKKGKKLEKAVAIARASLRGNNVKVVRVEAENADSALAGLAKQGYCIATADRALGKKIKAFGGAVIYLRQRRFLFAD